MVNMISVVAGFAGMIAGIDWLVNQSLSLGNDLAIGSTMAFVTWLGGRGGPGWD
jgi:hypothetical protein